MELLLSCFPGLILPYHDRYRHLHSGLSASHTTGTLSKLTSISLQTSRRTHGAHTQCAKAFQERDYNFPKHSTVQLPLNRTLLEASDL